MLARFARALLLVCALGAGLALVPAGALAHRVNVFAWLEGDTVHVQAGFSRKAPARQSAVTVLLGTDTHTAEVTTALLDGTTDDKGTFSFALPAEARKHGLTIRVNAGQGHQNEWLMRPEELAQSATTAPATPEQSPKTTKGMSSETAARQGGEAAFAMNEPHLRDIVGGLGWIVGLVGIGMALRARKRRV